MRSTKAATLASIALPLLAMVLFGLACERPAEYDAAAPPIEHPPELGDEMDMPSPSGELVDGVRLVKVSARQFEFDPETIVVRVGEQVRLEVTSEDVAHGFSLPAYGVDRALPSNETEVIEFTANQPGEHEFYCSVYCGEGHARMTGRFVVKAD